MSTVTHWITKHRTRRFRGLYGAVYGLKGGENVALQNHGFIGKKCEVCGCDTLVFSKVKLTCNYGSKNDGETVSVSLCGECADKIYSILRKGKTRNEKESKKH